MTSYHIKNLLELNWKTYNEYLEKVPLGLKQFVIKGFLEHRFDTGMARKVEKWPEDLVKKYYMKPTNSDEIRHKMVCEWPVTVGDLFITEKFPWEQDIECIHHDIPRLAYNYTTQVGIDMEKYTYLNEWCRDFCNAVKIRDYTFIKDCIDNLVISTLEEKLVVLAGLHHYSAKKTFTIDMIKIVLASLEPVITE